MDATSLKIALKVDKSLPTPAYLQLKTQLAQAIREQRLSPGAALPSERDLAAELALSRMTVRRAFEALSGAGLVEQRQGSGTYVRRRELEQPVDRVLGFSDEARLLGFEPGTELLEIGRQPADEETARALELAEGTPVLVVTRLRTADGEPLAVQIAFLPPPLLALSRELLRRNGSLYRTVREQFGFVPHHARQSVAARLPTHRQQRLLGVGPHAPLLALERTTFDRDGVPFEFVKSVYRSDRYRLALELRPPEASPGASSPAGSSPPEPRRP